MAFTKFTTSESLSVKTEKIQSYFKRVGKVNYEQLTEEEKQELNKELNDKKE